MSQQSLVSLNAFQATHNRPERSLPLSRANGARSLTRSIPVQVLRFFCAPMLMLRFWRECNNSAAAIITGLTLRITV